MSDDLSPWQNGRGGIRQKAGRLIFLKHAALCRDAATMNRAFAKVSI
jgi:hypothetical protein